VKIIPILFLLACASGDDTEPEIPTCAELGAQPDDPLFCTAEGLCTYDGMQCRRVEPKAE